MPQFVCVPSNIWNTMLDDFRLSHPELAREYAEEVRPIMGQYVWVDGDADMAVGAAVEDETITPEERDECLSDMMDQCDGQEYIGDLVRDQMNDHIMRWRKHNRHGFSPTE